MSKPRFHCQVQLRRHEKAGKGGERKRSRNSDMKWTCAFPGRHEQTEGLTSTKLNGTSGFLALEGRPAERSVKSVPISSLFLRADSIYSWKIQTNFSC